MMYDIITVLQHNKDYSLAKRISSLLYNCETNSQS